MPDPVIHPSVGKPMDVVAASDDSFYVLSEYNVISFDFNGTLLREWGREGGEDGQFNKPRGIALDSSGKCLCVCGVVPMLSPSCSLWISYIGILAFTQSLGRYHRWR